MESARVVKPDEVAMGHLTPAEFWGVLTIKVCLATTNREWTDAVNSCFRVKDCKVYVIFLSEVDNTVQTPAKSYSYSL